MKIFNIYSLFLAILVTVVVPIQSFVVNTTVEENEDFLNNHLLETAEGESLKACDCGWRNSGVLGIVGGQETGINEFPSMAGLVNVNTKLLYCGAIIISDRFLLTAGHCVFQKAASSLAVLVGEHNIATGSDTPYSAVYFVNAYEINPSYNPNTYANDIAILQTKTQIIFSSFVGPVCLPFRYSTAPFDNQAVTILGWGQIQFSGPTSDVLLKATLGVVPSNTCAASLGQTIAANEICTFANGRDSCQSDSGGPVLWTDSTTNRMHLVGIISHGIGCASSFPGINTRVTSHLNWILSRTSGTSYCNR